MKTDAVWSVVFSLVEEEIANTIPFVLVENETQHSGAPKALSGSFCFSVESGLTAWPCYH